jgi:hypothetical protein
MARKAWNLNEPRDACTLEGVALAQAHSAAACLAASCRVAELRNAFSFACSIRWHVGHKRSKSDTFVYRTPSSNGRLW